MPITTSVQYTKRRSSATQITIPQYKHTHLHTRTHAHGRIHVGVTSSPYTPLCCYVSLPLRCCTPYASGVGFGFFSDFILYFIFFWQLRHRFLRAHYIQHNNSTWVLRTYYAFKNYTSTFSQTKQKRSVESALFLAVEKCNINTEHNHVST